MFSSISVCLSVYLLTGLLSLSLLMGIFPGDLGLAGTRMFPFWMLLELRLMEVVMTTGAIRRAKLQSNRHHQQTITQQDYFTDQIFMKFYGIIGQNPTTSRLNF